MGRQGYDPMLRRRVIDLLESGKSVREVAEELGVSGLKRVVLISGKSEIVRRPQFLLMYLF
jgi:transposase-like protein